MKNALILTALFSTLASASQVSYQLMKVTKHSGFVPPQYRYSLKCDIGSDRTSLEQTTGENGNTQNSYPRTVYTAAVPNAAAAKAFITTAAGGQIVTVQGPTDGPSSTYVGILEGAVVDSYVKIYTDYSSTRYENTETAARLALVEFANANCDVQDPTN